MIITYVIFRNTTCLYVDLDKATEEAVVSKFHFQPSTLARGKGYSIGTIINDCCRRSF